MLSYTKHTRKLEEQQQHHHQTENLSNQTLIKRCHAKSLTKTTSNAHCHSTCCLLDLLPLTCLCVISHEKRKESRCNFFREDGRSSSADENQKKVGFRTDSCNNRKKETSATPTLKRDARWGEWLTTKRRGRVDDAIERDKEETKKERRSKLKRRNRINNETCNDSMKENVVSKECNKLPRCAKTKIMTEKVVTKHEECFNNK